MNGSVKSIDIPRMKTNTKWVAFHLGSFVHSGSSQNATQKAMEELIAQVQDGRYRELQVTIDIDRTDKRLVIRRWLDQVALEDFSLVSVTSVTSHAAVSGYSYLNNLISFNTPMKSGSSSGSSINSVQIEIHIFQMESYHMVNYLASDVRAAVEEAGSIGNKGIPIRVLPSSDKNSRPPDFEAMLRNEEITSKTERNLLLLNYCFDDIEFFLQHLKDQEDAQKILKSNKNKTSDRVLEGKAKPSTQSAYVACVQKIKFSLNLLSKLQGKIKNPDSAELAVLLSENLIRIGQAYSVYHNGKLAKIREPLLTGPTVKLLQACVTKTQLRSLTGWGECWIKPREKWSNYKEVYYPEFFNGHQIDLEHLVKDGIISEMPASNQVMSSNARINQAIISNQQFSVHSDNNDDLAGAVLSQRQEDFCRSSLLRNGQLYKVTSSFTASKEEELSIMEGEIIEVVELRQGRNWWMCMNMQGEKGFAPNTVIEPFHYKDRSISPSNSHNTVRAPSLSNSPKAYKLDKKASLAATPINSRENQVPVKPKEEVQSVQEELKKKLGAATSNFGNANSRASFARPGPVVSRKHGQLSINQDSTVTDVQKWLRFKKFSEEDINKLDGFNGKEMFLISRDHMNRFLGGDKAARLESLVKVQKSLSGFGTMSKRELEEILNIRKGMVECQETF